MKVDKEIYEIYKKLDKTEDIVYSDELINEFFNLFNRYNFYTKQCILHIIIRDLVDDVPKGLQKLNKYNNNIKIIAQNMTNSIDTLLYFDFKDIGQYVKFNNEVFEVKERTDDTITYNGEKITIDDCEISSIQELRKQKIKKLFINEKGLD